MKNTEPTTSQKRGVFTMEFDGRPETFRMGVNEIALLEERLNKGVIELIQGAQSIRFARELVFICLGRARQRAKQAWTPMKAGRALEDHLEKGGDWAAICSEAVDILIASMPELKEAIDEETAAEQAEDSRAAGASAKKPQSGSPSTSPADL